MKKSIIETGGPKLTDQIGRAVSYGFDDRALCRALGIGPRALWVWKKRGIRAIDGPYRQFWLSYCQGEAKFMWRVHRRQRIRE
jgi:hypothetical protein